MTTFTRGINFVFTVNNPTENDEELLLKQVDETGLIEYLIYGHEIGDNGNYHWQGFCQLKNRLTLRQVKNFLPRAHIEKVLGTQKQAIDYCKKDGNFDEYGKIRKQGGSNKRKTKESYNAIKKRIVEDRDPLRKVILESCDNPSQIHYAQFMEKYAGLDAEPHPITVYWFYGPTGCGKSHNVSTLINKKSFWKSSNDLKWFDGYCGQEDVWIDDFRGSYCSFSFLLNLLDKWPLMVPVKGGFVRWIPKRIFITCPFKPQDCYAGIEDKTQLIRRIHHIQHFNVRYNPDGDGEVLDDEIPETAPEDDPNYAFLNGY